MSSIGQPPPGPDPHARGCVHGSTLRPLRAASSGSSVVQMHRHRHPGASRLQTAAAAVGCRRALLHLRAASAVISGSIIPGQLAGVASAGCARSGGRPLHCRAPSVCAGLHAPGGPRNHGCRRAPDALVIRSRHLRRPSRFVSSACTRQECSVAGCSTQAAAAKLQHTGLCVAISPCCMAINNQQTPSNPQLSTLQQAHIGADGAGPQHADGQPQPAVGQHEAARGGALRTRPDARRTGVLQQMQRPLSMARARRRRRTPPDTVRCLDLRAVAEGWCSCDWPASHRVRGKCFPPVQAP